MNIFYFGGFRSGSTVCLKRESNQVYVFIFVENVGDKSRLHSWRDVGEGDIKIFLANLIAMGLVRKGSMPKYWDHGETVKTSFFGIYMGCNTFQSIMSNLQVADSTLDLPRNHPCHDPLFKECPFMDMLQKILKGATSLGGT